MKYTSKSIRALAGTLITLISLTQSADAVTNIISIATDPFIGEPGNRDPDGVHQVSTTDFGDFSIQVTDDSLGTPLDSLTHITPTSGGGALQFGAFFAGPGTQGIGFASFVGDAAIGTWFVLSTDDGGSFQFTGLDIRETVNVFTDFEIVGFLDNAQVATEQIGINLLVENPGLVLTDSLFQNVDEIRIRQMTPGFFDSGMPGLELTIFNNFVIDTAVVPEPASALPLSLAILCLALQRRKRR